MASGLASLSRGSRFSATHLPAREATRGWGMHARLRMTVVAALPFTRAIFSSIKTQSKDWRCAQMRSIASSPSAPAGSEEIKAQR